jgi:PAS domain S-box-containing protein
MEAIRGMLAEPGALPAVLTAGLGVVALALVLVLWRQTRLLSRERARSRAADRIVGLLEELSGRRSAERGLLAALEALPDGFVLYDAQDRLLLCNSRYRELYAMSADAIRPGARFEDIIRIGVARGQYADALEDPERWIAERLEQHLDPPRKPIEQAQGNGHWLRVFERRMPDGHTVGFRVDITDLKQREEALRLSEGRLAAVVNSALDAIVVIDEDGRIVEFNPSAERVFGYRRDDVMGGIARELLVPQRHRATYDRRIADVIACRPTARPADRIEARSLRADGSETLTEVTFGSVDGHDGPLVIGFIRDITEERAGRVALTDALARAEEADRAKSDFLAMMSHEIRTPLNAVIGLLDMMLEGGLDDPRRAQARTARGSAEALLHILNDILDFSRLETRRFEFRLMPFDLRELVASVGDLFAARAREKRLLLRVEVDEAVPPVVVGDAGRIRQVLVNLLANAVKFTPEGEVLLRLELRAPPTFVSPSAQAEAAVEASAVEGAAPVCPVATPLAALRFSVEDTGPGIPGDDRSRVFERFRSISPDGGGHGDGVGLGLAICRELVTGMGGTISVAGAPAGGCRFLVDLDLAAGGAPLPEQARQGIRSADARTLRGASILVAEDNPTNRMMVAVLLDRWGCRHVAVHDGAAVLPALEAGDFDAVLMDVSMPGMSGYEATTRLRASGASFARLPVVALTAHARPDEYARAFAAGMDAFVTKPIDSGVLARVLAALLRGERPEHGGAVEAAVDPCQLSEALAEVPRARRAALIERCVADLRHEAARAVGLSSTPARLGACAHVVGGLAETFGAPALARIAREIETGAAKQTDAARLAEQAGAMAREACRAADAFARLAAEPDAEPTAADASPMRGVSGD